MTQGFKNFMENVPDVSAWIDMYHHDDSFDDTAPHALMNMRSCLYATPRGWCSYIVDLWSAAWRSHTDRCLPGLSQFLPCHVAVRTKRLCCCGFFSFCFWPKEIKKFPICKRCRLLLSLLPPRKFAWALSNFADTFLKLFLLCPD